MMHEYSSEIPFGKRLNNVLKYKSMKQRQLANICGFDESHLSKMIKGQCMPSIRALAHISDVLDVKADYLLGLTSAKIENAFREKVR